MFTSNNAHLINSYCHCDNIQIMENKMEEKNVQEQAAELLSGVEEINDKIVKDIKFVDSISSNDLSNKEYIRMLYGDDDKQAEESYNAIQPNHYNSGDNDLIAFTLLHKVGFNEGNVMKYVFRYKNKNGLQDLYKAKEYLDRLIAFEESKFADIDQ